MDLDASELVHERTVSGTFPRPAVHGGSTVVGEGGVCEHFQNPRLWLEGPAFAGSHPLGQARRPDLEVLLQPFSNGGTHVLEERRIHPLMQAVCLMPFFSGKRRNLRDAERCLKDEEGRKAHFVAWALAGVDPPTAVVPDKGRAGLHFCEGQGPDLHALTPR
tara:strand:+ start:54 stop:539 length:486 start_codon:yes stop_codon:yes gene_type:complete